MEIEIWDDNYKKGRYNKWPYDIIVSFIIRYYGSTERNKTKILDLGCGGGNHTVFLAEEGFNTYAIDGSHTAIEITKERLKQKGLDANLQTANFKSIPFEDNSFDCVLDRGSIICNKWDDIIQIYDEVFRVLKKNGKYIGILQSVDHPQRKFGEEFEENTYTNFKGSPSFEGSSIIHFFTVEEIKELMKNYTIELVLELLSKEIINPTDKPYETSQFIAIIKK